MIDECAICRKPVLPNASAWVLASGTVCACSSTQPPPSPSTVPPRPKVLETDVQADIVARLRRLGYTVLETSERRRKVPCVHCHKWSHPPGGRGTSYGVPDLLVGREEWGARWLGLEVKQSSGGRLSPAQTALHQAGMIVIVRCWADVEAALRAFLTESIC